MKDNGIDGLSLGRMMELSQRGDKHAYRQLLIHIRKRLKVYISRQVNRPDAVEDILQEVLIGIHEARDSFDTNRPFEPWMFAIARFKIADFHRRRIRVESHETSVQEELETIEGNLHADWTVIFRGLLAILKSLPLRQRQIIEYLKVEGLSVRETALAMNMSEGAVRVSAHRAYKALKTSLGASD